MDVAADSYVSNKIVSKHVNNYSVGFFGGVGFARATSSSTTSTSRIKIVVSQRLGAACEELSLHFNIRLSALRTHSSLVSALWLCALAWRVEFNVRLN